MYAYNAHFEVAVADAVLVAVQDRLEDLLHAVARVRLRVELTRHDVLEELAARHPTSRYETASSTALCALRSQL